MANRIIPFRNVPGETRVLKMLGTEELPWPYAQRFGWECKIDHTNIYGEGTSQVDVITIPAAGFVSGSLTLTFSGDALDEDVDVVAYAAAGDTNEDLATAMEVAIAAARAADLAGIVTSETVDGDDVYIVYVAGIGRVNVTMTWRSAQQVTVQLTGVIYDAIYRLTLTGGGLADPVAIDTTRAAGTPATIADMVVQRETDAEGLIATTLAGVLVSANDDGVDLNTFVFEPDITDVTITPSIVLDTEAMAQAVEDVTPAGPTVTIATTLTIDLNTLSAEGGFPSNALREYCFVNVVTGFGAGRTLTVGDENETAGLAGTTPIDLDTVARSSSVAADAYYLPAPVTDFAPTATIVLGDDSEVTDGDVRIEICWYPNLANE